MFDWLPRFEQIVRRAGQFTEARSKPSGGLHPFDERNIHLKIQQIVCSLFDNGHYAQATFEAYKFIDKEVQRQSSLTESGFALMMKAFAAESPLVQLTPLSTTSQKDEQKGYQFLFAGSVLAIRNPRGHEYGVVDSIDECLDHLNLASMLLRRLEESSFK
jgi:uncharacterized protein (TIGR02391 family)